MRHVILPALVLAAGLLAGPAFAGDITMDNNTITANGNLRGQQTSSASGLSSIAQAGTASIQQAGRSNLSISNSTIDLTGTVGRNAVNSADASGASAVAQAGVASIQAASAPFYGKY